jgi:hypothetical protein
MTRRAQNRPVDELDFPEVKLFAEGGLHWAGVHSWFGRPVDETRRYIFDAWPELFAKIEASTARTAKSAKLPGELQHTAKPAPAGAEIAFLKRHRFEGEQSKH